MLVQAPICFCGLIVVADITEIHITLKCCSPMLYKSLTALVIPLYFCDQKGIITIVIISTEKCNRQGSEEVSSIVIPWQKAALDNDSSGSRMGGHWGAVCTAETCCLAGKRGKKRFNKNCSVGRGSCFRKWGSIYCEVHVAVAFSCQGSESINIQPDFYLFVCS